MDDNRDLFEADDADHAQFDEAVRFRAHTATPTCPSSCAPSPTRAAEPTSSFQRSFANVQPASPVSDRESAAEAWRIPKSLSKYWEENIPESLRRFSIPSENVFYPICMTPTDEQIASMCARSKCMEVKSPKHASLLSKPTMGQCWCFIEKGGEGIPPHIQKALHFFASLMHSLLDLAHFTAPTKATNVVHDRADKKVVRALVSTGQGLLPDPVDEDDDSQADEDEFISMDSILSGQNQESSDHGIEPVQPISIHLGFTGATFKNGDGKEKREAFAVLMITPAENFALLPYIYEKFLKKPKLGSQKYEQLMELYLESSSFFKEIMRYECFCNLLADEDKMGLPEDYKEQPAGKLGILRVLSPFQIPIKIFNIIKTNYPTADLTSIRIIGCPEMTFQKRDDFTRDWVKYMDASIWNEAKRQENLLRDIDKYCEIKDKDREAFVSNQAMGMSGGWPVCTDENCDVTVFGLPPLPLMHKFDANGARGSFSVFIASIGDADQALPDLTRAILTAFLVHSSDLDERPEVDHLLKDKRKANPLLVLRTYHGPDADPFSALVLANRHRMWAEALRTDIQVRRSKGCTVQEVLRVKRDYLASCMRNLESMIECQVFRSATVTQMKSIYELMDFEDVCFKSDDSIRKVMAEKSQRLAKCRRYDGTFRAWNCFMRMWEDMNVYFTLNAGNLLCALEVMLSQLMSKFAHTNETWTFFFMTVIVMSGNGHYQNMTPDGPVPCRIKKNTTGMDYLLARLTDLQNTLYERLKIPPKDRHNIILNCMRATPTVWENLVTAQAAGGRLVAVPPADANFQAMSLTEIRDGLKALIQYGPPRGEENGQTCSFNSQEMENKSRVASRKRKMGNNCIVVMASNVGSKNKEQKEEGDTLDAVAAVLPSGVPPPVTKCMRKDIHHQEANSNTGRHQPLENKARPCNCIAYTSIVAGLVALLNHIGAMSVEINPGVAAFYDWACYYIKQFASSCMDVFVRDNFSRMKEGYKSRGVVLSIWLKTISALSMSNTKEEAMQQIWMDIHTDALPLVNTTIVFSNLLYRGIHMGSVMMSNVIADHLDCPVVSTKHLNMFFELEGQPNVAQLEPGFREDYLRIQEYVTRCIHQNRFCPAEDGSFCLNGNVCCYITSDAAADLTPVNPKNSLLRVLPSKDKDDTQDITHKVALRIATQYGEVLNGQCHMGPEVATYKLAIVHLIERFAPDFRGLISSHMFSYAKHIRCLGLSRELPGIQDYADPTPPPYARQFSFRSRDQLQSQAVGVNLFAMLFWTAMVGNKDLHPDASACFGNSFIELLLSHAPAPCTPGNICPTTHFDHATAPVRLFITDQNRPRHFLRPAEPSFVNNGVLPIAKISDKRFIAEDILHCSQLVAVAKTLHCDVMEVPANAFSSAYALMPDTPYTFHVPHPDEGKYGFLMVNLSANCVEVNMFDSSDSLVTSETLDFLDWEHAIRQAGIVITPLIRRHGAAVQLEDGSLGCLIPPENSEDLLDSNGCVYYALINAEMEVRTLPFLVVLRSALIPVGEILYLDMSVIEQEQYRSQGAGGKVLYTRLNVPDVRDPVPGKLYVTCLNQPKTARGRSLRSATCITLAVNPWDVQLASQYTGSPTSIVKHLY